MKAYLDGLFVRGTRPVFPKVRESTNESASDTALLASDRLSDAPIRAFADLPHLIFVLSRTLARSAAGMPA
ncbi:hypothetical protein NS277_15645 [Novosphingobium barchaimii]|nr:hypothetical protein NS277_15645 [Novosphingobium barchaimii]